MENKINKKIAAYIGEFKRELDNRYQDSDLKEFVQKYPVLILEKEDFIKRKRQKTTIPLFNRCIAKRINGEQCTRRKKDTADFCGTHLKGAPNGTINATQMHNYKNLEVFTEEICGIIYYLDDNGNIYHSKDVMENKCDPRVVANYTKAADGSYVITG